MGDPRALCARVSSASSAPASSSVRSVGLEDALGLDADFEDGAPPFVFAEDVWDGIDESHYISSDDDRGAAGGEDEGCGGGGVVEVPLADVEQFAFDLVAELPADEGEAAEQFLED